MKERADELTWVHCTLFVLVAVVGGLMIHSVLKSQQVASQIAKEPRANGGIWKSPNSARR